MGNKDQLEILYQGVKVWNRWRYENFGLDIDLSEEKLPNDLCDARFEGAYLVHAKMRGANLRHAVLNRADLLGADLSCADLTTAILSFADLTAANLRSANLTGASLNGTILSHTILEDANFSKAEVSQTIFSNNDLSTVKGLESVIHHLPSTIGIDTIYLSNGKIPDVFLRRAGVPDNFITYLPSLTTLAIKYYTCFISFTESDDVFSQRLYNDLQAAGVRCWRWKEDAKWGKNLTRSVDEAVRVYNKLVVICSKQSLNSPAVIREIERALQKEDELMRQGKESEVLFPIRLDDYIFSGWNHYRKADVIAKNIGDFRDCNEPEIYRKSLDRLVRDLEAEWIK